MSEVEIELPEGPRETAETPDSGRGVIAVSVAAFVALVLAGAGIGVLVGPGSGDEVGASTPSSLATPTTSSPQEAPSAASSTTAAPTTTAPPSTTVTPTTTAAPTTTAGPTTVVAAQPVAILELTKAVQDQLDLTVGDEVFVNVITNDRGTNDQATIALTGLGELAPGFVLQSNGTLAGTASDCGRWQVQYELSSGNSGRSTSWIDITVSGC